uniref:C2H2-type domain-containing protein n=1 Tax=viral metagenome TaxID=1070528 RepID=A0A6C0K9N1_9ZZZZ
MSEKNPKKKYGNKKVEYYCEKCDFLTSNKKDYTRHLKTKKHNRPKKTPKKSSSVDFVCVVCKKKYKHQSSWSRHQTKCLEVYSKSVELEQEMLKNIAFSAISKNPKNDNFEEMNQKVEEFENEKNEKKSLKMKKKEIEEKEEFMMKMIEQQNKTIELLKQSIQTNQEMSKNVGNNNNNTISINLFLNENCKNAMNLTDFIQNMNVSLEDLEFSKDNGFVKGVTNIFTKQLQDLDPTQRPIHCSDKKRLQFYVKEDDVWQKDLNNEKIDRTITNIKIKQAQSLTEWEKDNPNFQNDPVLLDKWQYMMANLSAVEGKEKASKNIARNIADVLNIKEAMPKK